MNSLNRIHKKKRYFNINLLLEKKKIGAGDHTDILIDGSAWKKSDTSIEWKEKEEDNPKIYTRLRKERESTKNRENEENSIGNGDSVSGEPMRKYRLFFYFIFRYFRADNLQW